jgi:hypothetical protein
MRKTVLVVLMAMGGVVATAPAKTKKEAELSKLFCQARYVYVETYEGDLNPEIARQYPVDYDAAVGVEQRIQGWGRYKLASGQQQADLVFVVWKARPEGNRLPGQPTQMPPVSVPQMPDPGTGQNPRNPQGAPGQNPGGMPGQNPQGMPGQNPGGGPDGVGVSHGGPGVAVYPTNDQLAVYQAGDESLGAQLWKKQEKDGLKEPRMTLFGELADAVDDACSDAGK